MKSILISEIFGPTIQGEGSLIGRPTVFVRTGGCDFRCSFCDTLYAVLPEHKGDWTPQSPAQIIAEVEKLTGGFPILTTVSGGNPALQPLEELLDLGHARGHTFALETQASRPQAWFSKLDHLVLSPKPPSSGMEFLPQKLVECIESTKNEGTAPDSQMEEANSTKNEALTTIETQLSLKVVVFDEADYGFARRVHALHPEIPFYLSVGNPSPQSGTEADSGDLVARFEWLLARAARDGWFGVTISPQLHVLLWGNKRGV